LHRSLKGEPQQIAYRRPARAGRADGGSLVDRAYDTLLIEG
jgi:hypothetical protein